LGGEREIQRHGKTFEIRGKKEGDKGSGVTWPIKDREKKVVAMRPHNIIS
jgi:hypothetical protein